MCSRGTSCWTSHEGAEQRPSGAPIDVHVSRLRRRIEVDPGQPDLIKTVRCGGYVFAAAVTVNGQPA